MDYYNYSKPLHFWSSFFSFTTFCSNWCLPINTNKGADVMSFSANLRNEANPIFNAIFEHPFVQGIAERRLKKGAVDSLCETRL